MAEMQGGQALKQFIRKGGIPFSKIFALRHKNVIIVVYGKDNCSACPTANHGISANMSKINIWGWQLAAK